MTGSRVLSSKRETLRRLLDDLTERKDAAEQRAVDLEDRVESGIDNPAVAEAYGIVEGLEQAQDVLRQEIALEAIKGRTA